MPDEVDLGGVGREEGQYHREAALERLSTVDDLDYADQLVPHYLSRARTDATLYVGDQLARIADALTAEKDAVVDAGVFCSSRWTLAQGDPPFHCGLADGHGGKFHVAPTAVGAPISWRDEEADPA